jgi:4-alpha-glucanotransferase
VVSGVPPDYFSATGQRWGNPLYLWKQIEKTGFDWWVKRVQRQMELYDVLRLDHFRGFEAYWEIDTAEETAVNGRWVEAPGAKLFKKLQAVLGKPLPLVAEDLGLITAKVDKLREDFAMPGMRVMQFGFSDRGAHLHLPHKWVQNMVAYTGTHDNNTTLGWYRDDVDDETRHNVQSYVGPLHHENDVVWALIRAAERSVANTCIIPLQDLLHLGSDARMNTPAGTDGNWAWRFHPDALHPDIAAQMASITEMTDRDGYVPPDEASGETS